ncbi:MAG: hypothetical protein AAF648_10250 [Pseudomonadota bacterium]
MQRLNRFTGWGVAVAVVAFAVAVGGLTGARPAQGYEGSRHQELTFLAARYFNACIDAGGLNAKPLTPLQVRYIAKTNRRQAQGNFFGRLFRWDYYDPHEQSTPSLLWLVDTRFHRHFDEVVRRVAEPRSQAAFFSDLGRLVNYVQDVTSPAQTVPVYTGRFWRFSLGDRFNGFPIDSDAVHGRLDDACAEVRSLPSSYDAILRQTAAMTLAAIERPLDGMPVSWQAFWRPDPDPGDFGDYGAAGNNFGKSVQFRCGDKDARQRCVLLDNDPLYRAFALDRHRDAVIATMRVLLLAQQRVAVDGLAPGGH